MTKIEWTEQTWNPIIGCSIHSPGCAHCYAMPMARRLEAMGHPLYAGLTRTVNGKAVWTGKLAFNEAKLLEPLRRRKPTRYFVNSMSDLFHEDVPDAWIHQVFAVMALTPQHTYQVLTKRSARMRDYLETMERCFHGDGDGYAKRWGQAAADVSGSPCAAGAIEDVPFPIPNVWLGVSTEDQRRADERIPDLLNTPAAVRFISAEPLLGPIDLTAIDVSGDEQVLPLGAEWLGRTEDVALGFPRLDWVILGGESGPGARPMHPDWARGLRDQCAAAGVPFFFKQWGNWRPLDQFTERVITRDCSHAVIGRDGRFTIDTDVADPPDRVFTFQLGKADAGRLLDGHQHDGYPETRR